MQYGQIRETRSIAPHLPQPLRSIPALSPMSDEAAASLSHSATQKVHAAVQALSLILGPLPSFPSDPAAALLHDAPTAREISHRLRQPNSGAGDDSLCRWLYDTFQSTDPALQLLVLRFIPVLAGVYLSRAVSRKPLAGFEAVLLALYAHETLARGGEPVTVAIAAAGSPNIYEPRPAGTGTTKTNNTNNKSVEAEPTRLAVLSPVLEPHGTVRSTKRARIVGVALELYYSKISLMPDSSKLEFCGFCVAWCGGAVTPDDEDGGEKGGRIPMPWELFQPTVRIVGHCLLAHSSGDELKAAALVAARSLHERAMHEMSPQAVLAARSLMRLGSMGPEVVWEDPVSSVAGDSSKSEAAGISV